MAVFAGVDARVKGPMGISSVLWVRGAIGRFGVISIGLFGCLPSRYSRSHANTEPVVPVRDGTALLVLVNPHGFGLYRMR